MHPDPRQLLPREKSQHLLSACCVPGISQVLRHPVLLPPLEAKGYFTHLTDGETKAYQPEATVKESHMAQ